MVDEKITSANLLNRSVKYVSPGQVTFHVGGEERLRIDKNGFYVDGRLVVGDLEIYEAFTNWLNQANKLNQG